jgi:LacI family transcriptional regulator
VSVLVSTTHEEPAREAELLAQLRSRRVDGLILMPAGGDEAGHLERAAADGVPVVAIDRQPPGWAGDCVVTDHREASKLATEHLLAAGHRSIAFVGHLPRISSAQARLAGYRQAMAEAGAPIDDNLVALGNHNAEIAHRTALRMLTSARPPTAFFSAQDVITLGVVRALHERGAQHRIALVGFDDVPLADLLDPPLTVIAQDPRLIGELAAERVFARQDHPGLPPETITVAGRLIRRGSGEIPPP